MGLYPPLKSGETHRLQHVAEVRFRLEKERDLRASMYKKYRRGANVVDGIDTALSVTSVGLSWFNWWVSFAPEFQCYYFCESSCLFYLSLNSDSYVSKIMHL